MMKLITTNMSSPLSHPSFSHCPLTFKNLSFPQARGIASGFEQTAYLQSSRTPSKVHKNILDAGTWKKEREQYEGFKDSFHNVSVHQDVSASLDQTLLHRSKELLPNR